MLFLLRKKATTLKNPAFVKSITKTVQNKIISYFLKLENHVTKPKSRCAGK